MGRSKEEYKRKLIAAIAPYSKGEGDAVFDEWKFASHFKSPIAMPCGCGKESCLHINTLFNPKTKTIYYPIGSTCVNKFLTEEESAKHKVVKKIYDKQQKDQKKAFMDKQKKELKAFMTSIEEEPVHVQDVQEMFGSVYSTATSKTDDKRPAPLYWKTKYPLLFGGDCYACTVHNCPNETRDGRHRYCSQHTYACKMQNANTCKFKKHKGKLWNNVLQTDLRYVGWLLDKSNMFQLDTNSPYYESNRTTRAMLENEFRHYSQA